MSEGCLAALSFSHPTFTQEAMIIVATVITLVGTRLSWGASRYRMSIEERAKDGKLTEDQARRRIRTMDVSGPMVIVLGVTLLVYALLA